MTSAATLPGRLPASVGIRELRSEVAAAVLASEMAAVTEAVPLRSLPVQRKEAHLAAAAHALRAAAAHHASREPGPVEAAIAAGYVARLLGDPHAVRAVPFARWAAYKAAAASAIPRLAPLTRCARARLEAVAVQCRGHSRTPPPVEPVVAAIHVVAAPAASEPAPPTPPTPREAAASAWATPEERLRVLCGALRVGVDVAYGSSKADGQPEIRAVLYVCLRAWRVGGTTLSYPEIKRTMRKSNHSTVMHAEKRVRKDPERFRPMLEACRLAIEADGRGRLDLSSAGVTLAASW